MTERKYFVFSFDDVKVRESEFCIAKDGEVLTVEPKAFRVLLYLLHNPRKLITKEELLDAVWNDVAVSENSLARSIALLRKQLGDDTHEPRYIATVPTIGYRFLCDVTVTEDGFVASSPAETDEPGKRLNGDVQVAESAQAPSAEAQRDLPKEKRSKQWLYWGIGAVAVVAVVVPAALLLLETPPAPIVEGVSQITDDGNTKVISAVLSDGSRIYFNELREGTEVLAQVATSGGESGLITHNIPGSHLGGFASDPPRLLLLDRGSFSLGILPLPAGEPRKLPGLPVFDAAFFPDGDRKSVV